MISPSWTTVRLFLHSAFAHAAARSRAALAVFGASTAVTALAALFLGVLLHG